jgi:hypothetical protein
MFPQNVGISLQVNTVLLSRRPKLSVTGTVKCSTGNELFTLWISYQQAKGDNVNPALIKQKVKRILNILKASLVHPQIQFIFTIVFPSVASFSLILSVGM